MLFSSCSLLPGDKQPIYSGGASQRWGRAAQDKGSQLHRLSQPHFFACLHTPCLLPVSEHKCMTKGDMTQIRKACHGCIGVGYFVDGASPRKPPCGMGGTCRHKRPRWGQHQYCWPWLLVTGWKRWCLKPPSVCSASSMNCRDWR